MTEILPETIAESAWWRAALRGERPAIHAGQPQAGYFRRRLVKGGPWVPARIWIVEHRLDDGSDELGADTEYWAMVDGRLADAHDAWTWLCGQPIEKAEYDHLTAVARWARENDPDAPEARPTARVDLNAMAPIF